MAEYFAVIQKYLQEITNLPNAEMEFCASLLSIKTIKADEYFFTQGDVSHEVGFVLKGLLCSYYPDHDGNKYVKQFNFPGLPVACYAGLILSQPAHYSCSAIEDSVLAVLPFEAIKQLYRRHPAWQEVRQTIVERLFIEKELREEQFLSLTSIERYKYFCGQHPNWTNKIPQYLLASYIGITPVAFSRLKKKL